MSIHEASSEYPQYVFLWRNKKIISTFHLKKKKKKKKSPQLKKKKKNASTWAMFADFRL